MSDDKNDKKNGHHVTNLIGNDKRREIIKIFLQKERLDKEKAKISRKEIEKRLGIDRMTIKEHVEILQRAKIIYKVNETEYYSNDELRGRRKLITYSLDKNQLKYTLKKIWDEFFPDPKEYDDLIIFIINYISILEGLLPPQDRVTKSKDFMMKIPDNGKMEICFPAEAVQFVVTSPIYTNGYRQMKKRGIKIRVITEITKDNFKHIIKMMEDGMVDEIRILKKVSCGIAVSENQYMAAFLNKEFYNKDVPSFGTTMYYQDENIIKLNQSIFDILWENAVPIFKI